MLEKRKFWFGLIVTALNVFAVLRDKVVRHVVCFAALLCFVAY